MKHFGVFLTDLESERFLTASNDQIATWLFLHALCSKQMNGGTIEDAASLPERFWSRHGIAADILVKASPLWSWKDSDLSVEPYDIDGEVLYLKKSKGGKIGMEKRWNGSGNKSLNKSLNRPDQTRPDQTLPDQTKEEPPPFGDEELFDKQLASTKPKARGTIEELRAHALKIGLRESDGEHIFHVWESNGWKNGRNPVKCWTSAMTVWKNNGWFPSQKNGTRPESFDEVDKYAESQSIAHKIAEAYWDSRKSVGWKKSGQPIVDWKQDLIGFTEAWRRNADKSNPAKTKATTAAQYGI